MRKLNVKMFSKEKKKSCPNLKFFNRRRSERRGPVSTEVFACVADLVRSVSRISPGTVVALDGELIGKLVA